MKKPIVLGLAALMTFPFTAQAEETKLEGTYKDWAVFSRDVSGDKICFAQAKPRSKTPTSVRHGDIYFMVSNWQSGAAKEQPSLLVGYPLKSDSGPEARIGSTRVPMFVSQNEAFIEESTQENRLVKAMRAGSLMRISAVSQRGTAVSYEFSLSGVTAALKKARTVCG